MTRVKIAQDYRTERTAKSVAAKAQWPRGGTRSQPDACYTILLMGETGSGKSTFVNMLVNFFRGGSLDRTGKGLKCAIPTRFQCATEPEGAYATEHDACNAATSKTTECTTYTFTYQNRSTGEVSAVKVIDTPGLSDNRGSDYDDRHMDSIIEAATQQPAIHALVFVMNGSVARVLIGLKNVFERLKGMMPDQMLQNLVGICTNCTSMNRNLDPRNLPFVIRPDNLFCMQNSVFSSDPVRWPHASKMEWQALMHDWKMSFYSIEAFMQRVTSMAPVCAEIYHTMRDLRNQIKTKMAEALNEIRNMQRLEDALERATMRVKGLASDKEKYKEYTIKNVIETNEIVDADRHSTLCSVCNHVCHDGCGLEFIAQAGDPGFRRCACMGSDSKCTQCYNHCGPSHHYHAMKTIKKVAKTVETYLDDMKAKYELAEQQLGEAQQDESSAQSDIDALKQGQAAKIAEVMDCCKELKGICQYFNFTEEVDTVLQTLKMERRMIKSPKARAGADQTIRDITDLLENLGKDQVLVASHENNHDYSHGPSICHLHNPSDQEEEDYEGEDDDDNESDPSHTRVGTQGRAANGRQSLCVLQ